MKSRILSLSLAAIAFIAAIPQAEARPHSRHTQVYISGYRSCGSPIYMERYFIGYDHCGNEIWGKRLVRQEYRPRYSEPCPRPCQSTYFRYEGSRGRSGFTIEGSFRR